MSESNVSRRTFIAASAAIAVYGMTACANREAEQGPGVPAHEDSDATQTDSGATQADSQQGLDISERVLNLLASMSLEQKIAQLIMPAIRAWNGTGVTDLQAAPGLADILRRHQYTGVILFGQNITDAEQTVCLTNDLQRNNASGADAQGSTVIPYLIAADQEGGIVTRLTMGTRGTGSMAIGATSADAASNALATGRVFGEELAALGINVNLAPCLDIITDLGDPGMSTRVFGDDPMAVYECGAAFAQGVGQSGVVTTFKHFPGAGDGSDYPTAVHLTLEQLREEGLLSYKEAIRDGADMLMTAAVTFPEFDDQVLLADGATYGYYPATMSPKVVGTLLREELGFAGVVMTDALEMDQFFVEPDTEAQLLPGERDSVEFRVNVAKACIAAGCDLLLIPFDISSDDSAGLLDGYLAGIAEAVEGGSLESARIDESVARILALKEKYGVLDMDVATQDDADKVAHALEVVGSVGHHDVERDIAQRAITLLKNDGVLPIRGSDANIVVLGRSHLDATPILYALNELKDLGILDGDANIVNNITGEITGTSETTSVFVDRYYDLDAGLVFSDALSSAIAGADYVVCLSSVGPGLEAIQDSSVGMQGVQSAFDLSREAGVPFVLLSDNLPVDAARFADADAIVCAYLSAGFDVDPTARKDGSGNISALNANVPAALRAIFGASGFEGTLPIDVPAMVQAADGTWGYGSQILFERGSGIQMSN